MKYAAVYHRLNASLKLEGMAAKWKTEIITM